jgi:hypothetical protein
MRRTGLAGLALLLPLVSFTPPAFALPVFPGAVGFGTDTEAGRLGTVYKVNSLSDAPNSSTAITTLREALEATGKRTVIFEVSGTITLNDPLVIRSPYITVAGQTAPSPGILVKGYSIDIVTHDVLIQHLAVRPGSDNDLPCGPGAGRNNRDAFRVFTPGNEANPEVHHVVLDHVSGSWTTDQSVSVYGHHSTTFVHDVTISNSLFAEPLHVSINDKCMAHGFGPFIAGRSHHVTFLRNVAGYNEARSPAIKDNVTDLVIANNLTVWPGTYGSARFEIGPAHTGAAVLRASAVGNVTIFRPTNQANNMTYTYIHPTAASNIRLYLQNNSAFDPLHLNGSGNQWYPISTNQWETAFTFVGSGPTVVQETTPPIWNNGIVLLTDRTEIENRLLNESGARPLDRDPVDTRIIANMRARTGATINHPDDVGGYPTLAQNTRTLSPPSSTADSNGNGYTDLEEWLHAFAAQLERDAPAVIQKDFESGNDSDLQSVSGAGTWARETDGASTVLRQSSPATDTRLALNGTNWTDQSVQADVKIHSFSTTGTDHWVGLSARFTDMNNHYFLTLRQSNVLQLRKKVNGTVTTLDTYTLTPSMLTWYRLRLEVVGNSLKVFLNGAADPVLQATDSSLPAGRVVLSMWGADASFDNVLATPNAQTTLLTDNFQDGNSAGWTASAGTWSVVNDGTGNLVYQQSNTASGDFYSSNGTGWANQIVEGDMRATTFVPDMDDWFALGARYTDLSNHYYVTFRNSGALWLRKVVGGTFSTLDSTTIPIATGTTYRVRLEAIGTSIKVYVNGVLQLEATDSAHSSGGVVLRTYRAATQYDNVQVLRP